MTEIREIYIAKHNDNIIGTNKEFWEAQITLVDEIVYDSCNSEKADKINDEYDGIEIYGTWYSAYDILDSLGDVDDVYRSIVGSSVDCMSAMDVGSYEEYEMDDDYSISCGLEITDDDGVVHIIDDEDLSNLDSDPITFTANDDGSRWNIAKIDGVYTIVPDDNKTYSACIVRVFDGVPKIAGHNEFNTKDEFDSWLVIMDSANAMLLNLYEDDEKVIATIYL